MSFKSKMIDMEGVDLLISGKKRIAEFCFFGGFYFP